MLYQIESRNLNDRLHCQWNPSAVGRDGNEFTTVAEAEAVIETLRRLDDDWLEAEYCVFPIDD